MTQTKKWVFTVIVLLLLALLAGGMLLMRSLTNAHSEYAALLSRACAMQEYARRATVQIAEDGQEPLTFSLDELGILNGTLAKIDVEFPELIAPTTEAFSKLPIRQQLEWARERHNTMRAASFDLSSLTLDAVTAALNSAARTQPQDAQFYYQNGRFVLETEQRGNELNMDAVTERITDALSACTVTENGASSPVIEISGSECYLAPQYTLSELDLNLADELQSRVENMTIRVSLRDDTTSLSTSTISSLLSVDESGIVSVDRAKLSSLAAAWGEQYNTYNTDFMLNSYVDGPIPISMLQCSYVLDEQALCDQLEAVLLTLESGDVTASFNCLDAVTGEPFVIQDTYIEVDLTNQVMTFYKNGKVLVSTDIVSGSNNVSATPRGLYFTGERERQITLSGDTWSVFVEYWVPISEDNTIGLHDASWRTEFGGDIYLENGSHGCINTPLEAMKTIYENVDDGTPVLVYHHARPGSNEPSL